MIAHSHEPSPDSRGRRARWVALAFVGLFTGLGLKATDTALNAPAAETNGIAVAFDPRPRRADILDRNGELLATSVTVYSLFADPRAIWDAGEVASALAGIFPDLDEQELAGRLSNRSRAFVWVRRGLTPRQRQAVFALGLEGLGFREEPSRAYPRGVLAGHVLGYANLDGEGLAGIEFALDRRLAEGGDPLRLTLDSGVQFALEAELAGAAARHDVDGAAGVVLHAPTGEVLAMASWPPVDPNRWAAADVSNSERLNRAAGAVYELGSVFKPLTVAAAFDAGVLHPADRFDVHEPVIIAGKRIFDRHPVPGRASPGDIIVHSSNVGTVRIALELGIRRQQDFLQALGLFDRAPVELAESAAPLLPGRWDTLSSATIAYGHGIAVSPVAFTAAFAAFANNGERVAPTLLLGQDRTPDRVMGAPTTGLVTAMLRETVRTGTGTRADVAGYQVAGKTGTAEKPVAGGYAEDINISSFAAVFPADRPEFAILVVLDAPKPAELDGTLTGTSAAWTAAPAVGRVVERIAPLLGLVPRQEDIARDGPVGEPPVRAVSGDRRSL